MESRFADPLLFEEKCLKIPPLNRLPSPLPKLPSGALLWLLLGASGVPLHAENGWKRPLPAAPFALAGATTVVGE